MLPVLLLFFIIYASNADKPIIISTPLGNVRGSEMKSTNGNIIHAFRGIRYAQAPVGELRFKPPKPVLPHSSTFDAREEGPACPQIFPELIMAEDCLMLNVYMRPGSQSNKKKPVIVFIHPGGFYIVSGQSVFFGPQYLLNHDVVLVSINYRLASLGFLSTGDELSPGNNGLKDQVMAFKWIKQNIASFGGDPDNVTLMGYSAGSYSISLHMVSPMSKGLFHRAIAMSAAATNNLKLPHHQLHLAQKQAELVGCPTNSSKEIIDCLRSVSNSSMAATYNNFFEFAYDPILIWQPVIEPDFGQERFLTDDPSKLILEGKYEKVPLLIGITEFEFAGPADTVIENETLRTEMNQEWNKIAPISFLYERNTPRSHEISQKLKEFYLESKDIQNDTRSIKGLRELYADGVIGFGVHRYVNLISAQKSSPVYYYCFTYKGRYSHYYYPSNGEELPVGTGPIPVHHDDMIYLFFIKIAFPEFNETYPEYKTMQQMTAMWSDFAITGNPTSKTTSLLENITWPQYTQENKKYLDIGSQLLIKERLYEARFSVWDELFPIDS